MILLVKEVIGMIQVSSFSKSYGTQKAVSDLSFIIGEGTICGFVGKNGSGKTTTMRTLMNMIFSDEGRLNLYGLDSVIEAKDIRRVTSYMPGDSNFYGHLKAGDLIRFTAAMFEHDPKDYLKIAQYFELDVNKKIEQLSLGNRKKVALVLALHPSKKILLLDEPTNGLDPLMQKKFFELMDEYRKRGVTIFLSSHNLNEVERYCDRVLMIKGGRLVEDLDLLNRTKLQSHKIEYRIANGNLIKEVVEGSLKQVLKTLSNQEITELVISPLSLEDEMIKYYEEGDEV